ncbi:putative ribonuclease H-like domain-containing protein [Tanacetum coccineum]
MNELCGLKGIKREFSVARTPQQNGVAERKNRTLIEAARTMLADSLLPTVFWAEAFNTTCYVLNRVLVTKTHNKTPYELLIGRPPSISFMRPFGCPIIILNTLDPLGKFDGKAEEGFLVGYSVNSKAFMVFNSQTRKVKENLHGVTFLKITYVCRKGTNWLFDIDSLTNSMNYQPVTVGNQTNKNAGPQEANGDTATRAQMKRIKMIQLMMLLVKFPVKKTPASENEQALKNVLDKMMDQEKEAKGQSDTVRKEFEAQCNRHNLSGKTTRASSTNSFNIVSTPVNADGAPRTSNDVGPSFVPLDWDNLYFSLDADQVMGVEADFNNMEPSTVVKPTKIAQALDDESWVEAMQEELLQFKIQKVWTLVDLPFGKKAIGTKWVYRNKKDERGIVMDVKSGTIEEEVYVSQPSGFVDPEFPEKVYKVEKALYGLHQAPRAWYETLSTYLLDNGFYRGQIDKTLFIKRVKDDILLVQVYVDDIILGSTKKYLCTDFGINAQKVPDCVQWERSLSSWVYKSSRESGWDLYLSRTSIVGSMIGLLMYLTSSRPDIIYLKGRPNLGLWYPKDSPFILEAFSDSDYAGASLDRKSTIGGCQFLGSRLISWQCKKQTVVANSTTEAEYIAASHCCGQVLWIQNQMLDYGYNFMQTKIHVDNESAICVVKNPVYHSKTKHIEIRHHFIRDSYEKRLIEMVKIHTDNNVADLLIKLLIYMWQSQAPRTIGGTPAQTRSERVLEKPNEPPLSKGHTSGSGKGRMEHQFELTANVPITPHDSPLSGGYTPGSDEGRLKLQELMTMCTKLSKQVLDLEKDKDAQTMEILRLMK